MRIKPVALIALRRLVGKRRVSQKDKRLFWLVESVWQAIKRGDDPGVAYNAAIRDDEANFQFCDVAAALLHSTSHEPGGSRNRCLGRNDNPTVARTAGA
jgi:hypothetical protein